MDAYLHVLDQIVQEGVAFGFLFLSSADRYVQTHNDHAHEAALEFVPQELGQVTGHGLEAIIRY